MVQAYRLLSEEMYARQWDYPLHLGVTEAGEGEDGRMKSAIGIGALLMDGLGDTIRVSLTEDPEFEIDPCGRLAALGKRAEGEGWGVPAFEEHRDTHTFSRRCGWVGSVGKRAWVECGLGSCMPASHKGPCRSPVSQSRLRASCPPPRLAPPLQGGHPARAARGRQG
jgi:4-hydroxy-3-methylbut-2-en-1-yl diphosphate synthase IspG/GcpE